MADGVVSLHRRAAEGPRLASIGRAGQTPRHSTSHKDSFSPKRDRSRLSAEESRRHQPPRHSSVGRFPKHFLVEVVPDRSEQCGVGNGKVEEIRSLPRSCQLSERGQEAVAHEKSCLLVEDIYASILRVTRVRAWGKVSLPPLERSFFAVLPRADQKCGIFQPAR